MSTGVIVCFSSLLDLDWLLSFAEKEDGKLANVALSIVRSADKSCVMNTYIEREAVQLNRDCAPLLILEKNLNVNDVGGRGVFREGNHRPSPRRTRYWRYISNDSGLKPKKRKRRTLPPTEIHG